MFRAARIKLTAWYLLIIMSISSAFSFAIYRVLTMEIDRFEKAQRSRLERRLREGFVLPFSILDPDNARLFPLPDPDLVNETKHRIFVTLVIVNGIILVLSGGFGYALAGRTLKPISEMLEEQNRFISDASHELKTPLTSLKIAMEVYLREKKPTIGETKTLIKESISEVNKLQQLSESLLMLSQYKNYQAKIVFSDNSTDEIIKSAMKKIAPLADMKKIQIKNTGKIEIVKGNKEMLTDLLVILLDNAVKYSHDNSVIKIETSTKEGYVGISIEDNGIGISKKDLPKIFERFYRADSARSRDGKGGYGLGLPIAYNIAKLHHGNIAVKSAIGKGSVFTVKLQKGHSKINN